MINKRKNAVILLLIVMLVIILSSCKKEDKVIRDIMIQPEVSKDYPVAAFNLDILEKPKRIISLSPAITEMIYEFGYGNIIVGRSDYCDYPNTALGVVSVGTEIDLNINRVLELSPDHVIVQSELSKNDKTVLETAGVKIIKVEKGKNFEEVKKIYKNIFLFFQGAGTGQAKFDSYATILNKKIENIEKAVGEKNIDVSGLYLVGIRDIAATNDTFEGEMLNIVGITNMATGTDWDMDFNELINGEKMPDKILITRETKLSEMFTIEELEKMGLVLSEEDKADIDNIINDKIIRVNNVPLERQSPRMFLELTGIVGSVYGSVVAE